MKAKWVKGHLDYKKGKYVADETYKYGIDICSNCKQPAFDDSDYGYQLTPYCPWCGAEMENSDYGL